MLLRIKKIFFRLLLFGTILIVLISILINMSFVQTLLANKVTNYFAKNYDVEVKIKKLDIDFVTKLKLEDVLIKDHHNDTLFFVPNFDMSVLKLVANKNKYRFKELNVDSIYLNIVQLEGEKESNLSHFLSKFSTDTTSTNTDYWIEFDALNIHNAKIDQRNDIKGEVNSIHNINVVLENIILKPEKEYFNLNNFSVCYNDELCINDMSMAYRGDSLNMRVDRFHIQVDKSILDSDILIQFPKDNKFAFDHPDTEYHLEIAETKIFAEELADASFGKWIKQNIRCSGKIDGSLKKIGLRDLDIQFGRDSYLKGEGVINQLLNEDKRNFKFVFNKLHFEANHLGMYLSDFDFNEDLKNKLIAGAPLDFQGEYRGNFRFNDLSGKLKTTFGALEADLELLFTEDYADANYQGDLNLKDVDLGAMLGMNTFGKTSLSTSLTGEGLSRENLDIKLNALIDYIGINGYNYQNAEVTGTFFKNSFVGEMEVNDTSLAFDFSGKVDLTGEKPIMDFEADVKYADLNMLNIVSDSIAIFSTHMLMNFEGSNLDNLIGKMSSYQTNYETLENYYFFNTISLEASVNEDGERRMDLNSDMVQAKLVGNFRLLELGDVIKSTIAPYVTLVDSIPNREGQNIRISSEFNNTRALSDLFMPDLLLATGSKLNVVLNSRNHMVAVEFDSPTVTFKENVFHDVSFVANTPDDLLNMKLDIAGHKVLEDLPLRDIQSAISMSGDSLEMLCHWNADTESRFDGGIGAKVKMDIPTGDYLLEFLPSQFHILDSLWQFNLTNSIHFDSTSCEVKNLKITTGHQEIHLDGLVYGDSAEHIALNLDHFELENIRSFLEEYNSAFSGNVNGTVDIYRITDAPYFILDLLVDTLAFNDMWMGDLYFKSKWNSANEDLSLDGVLMRGNIRSLDASGHYYPRLDQNKIVADISMDRFKFDYLEPYLNAFMSDLKGRMSGSLKFDDLGLYGDVELQKVRFSIPYLGTRYSIQGTPTVGMHTDKMHFETLQVNVERIKGKPNRSHTGNAVIKGDIFHDNFTDFIYDLDIELDDFLCLATKEEDNKLYYGDGFASGHVAITGEGGAPKIVIDASTEKGSNIVIPLADDYELEESSFLKFREPKKEDEVEIITPDEELIAKKFNLDLNLRIDPSAKVTMFLDQSTLTGSGIGDFRIMMESLDDFSINGKYTVSKADYLFGLQYNLLDKKNFTITEGGTITWDGDPYNGTMDIEAVYDQKVELSSLVGEGESDEGSTAANDATVYCKINMKGKIMKPEVSYSIEIPDASDQAKIRLRELTNSEEKMTLQFASFLATNNFYVTEQNINYVENTALSTGAGLITRQLNSLLNKAQDEFEVSVKFNPGTGTELSPQQIELLLSKNLLNDRLRLNGNFGTPIGANTSGMTGDVDVEYDLRKDGRLKLKVFNRSGTDIDEGAATNINTQGLGIFYRIEFDSLFKKKDKKSEETENTNQNQEAINPEDQELSSPDTQVPLK